jgi:hypothetical protein
MNLKSFLTKSKVPILVIASIFFLSSAFYFVSMLPGSTCIDSSKLKLVIQALEEKGYFEGQKDALKGDIRIAKTCSTWVWTKSPWNDAPKGSRYCIDSVLYHPEQDAIIIEDEKLKF